MHFDKVNLFEKMQGRQRIWQGSKDMAGEEMGKEKKVVHSLFFPKDFSSCYRWKTGKSERVPNKTSL